METSSSIQTAVGIKLTHEWQYYKKGETRDDPIDANEMPNIPDRSYKWKEDRDSDFLARVCRIGIVRSEKMHIVLSYIAARTNINLHRFAAL